MIARIWHGAVPAAKGDAYLKRMREVALPDYKSILGNRGAYCLHRIEGDAAHFDMLTFWDDVDAIKRFAGEDYQVAKYYDFDRSFLIELEPYVRHYTMYDA
jgi:heme-degrading monooxygenase HmoA